jgi:hypothetical protein
MKFFLKNQKKKTEKISLQMKQKKQMNKAVNKVLMTEIMQQIS